MRADVAGVACLLAAACGPMRVLTRPAGTGGWSAERRHTELAARADAAIVDLDGADSHTDVDVTSPLSLTDALRLAHAHDLRLVEADRDVAIAAARVRETRAGLLPRVTGAGRYTWYSDSLTNSIDLGSVQLPPGSSVPTATIRESEVGVVNGTAVVPLDVWGVALKRLTASQAGYRAERARRWATVLNEETAVIRAYFGLLEAERLRHVAEETRAAQAQQAEEARRRVDAGRLTRNELLVAEVAVQRTTLAIRQQELEVDRARWTLNQLIGRPVDAPTRAVDVTTRPTLPPEPDTLRIAYARNPVLLALIEEQQRLDDTLTSLARARLPRVEGGGAVDWSSADVVQPQRVTSAFLGVSVDLGTDGHRHAQISAARLAAERNRTTIERTLRELEAAVRSAHRATEERLAALTTAESAVLQAEENLRIRRLHFDVGRATSENVLDAEALVTEQRAVLAEALYQSHVRRAELEQLMGRAPGALVPER